MNRLIYATENHPLFKIVSNLDRFTPNLPMNSQALLIDLSATTTAKKRELFSSYKGPIISDLSLNNGDLETSSCDQNSNN